MATSTSGQSPPETHARLADLLRTKPFLFGRGDEELSSVALAAAKSTFDSALQVEHDAFEHIRELLESFAAVAESETPKTRAQARQAKKRKRTPSPEDKAVKREGNPMLQVADSLMPTQLQELHLSGMEDEQIWAQLELRGHTITKVVETLFEGVWDDPTKALDEDDQEEGQEDSEEDEVSMEGMDVDMEDSSLDEDEEDEGLDSPDEAAAEDDDTSGDENMPEHTTRLADSSDENDEPLLTAFDLDRPSRLRKREQPQPSRPRNRHPILDDNFFSIVDFNNETEAAEAQSKGRGRLDEESDEESVDLFRAVPEDEELADQDGRAEGGSYMYSDFFTPPPKSRRDKGKGRAAPNNSSPPSRDSKVRFHEEVRVKMVKPHGNMNSLYDNDSDSDDEGIEGVDIFDEDEQEVADSFEDDDGEEEEVGEESEEGEGGGDSEDDEDDENSEGQDEGAFETIERFKDDLFVDEGSDENNLSTFAQRQLALKEQIAQLEQENVAKKDWTLMGEANSRARPLNSLLEEDLEFEHSQRVVPVITEEKVKTLEEVIKARIIEGNFDSVVRKREVDDKPFLPSRIFELQDSKSAQSLAQIYEDEYTAAKAGGLQLDDRDGKLQREHEELEKIWEGIAGRLDALCNAHFTPKTPKGTITTLSNLPSTTLESALPTLKSVSSLLAPEEVFPTSKTVTAAKSELTPQEKRSQRARERKRKKNMHEQLASGVDKYAKKTTAQPDRIPVSSTAKGKRGQEKKEKEAALKSIVKTGKGVTIVGKKPQKQRSGR